jgi:hypothetical protein
MTATIKRKFVCVQPVSSMAKLRFNTEMDHLHSCYVDEENDGVMFLTSVNQRYKFTMSKKNDENWTIIK